jgi:para-nitrobenzyl esterase
MELPFVFGLVNQLDAIAFIGRDPHREDLMKQMQEAWISFAHTGNPNHSGLPKWPKYDVKLRATMELGITCQVRNDPQSGQRAAWDGIPFDGVNPAVQQISVFLSDNGQ